MRANWMVLINGKLADARNWPTLKDVVLNTATFFWGNDARTYQRHLIGKISTAYRVELKRIN